MSSAIAPTPGFIVASRSNPALNAQHILLGYQQFNAGNYDGAMMYFQLTEADPLQILSLFPDVLPSQLLQPATASSSSDAPAAPSSSSTSASSSPFASLPPLSAQKHPIAVQKVQGEERLFRALSALIPYLAQIQNRLRLSLEPLFAAPTAAAASSAATANGNTAAGHSQTGKRNNQSGHSKQSSVGSGQKDEDSSAKKRDIALAILVDTVLLKAYLLCDIPLLPFLSSPYNLCDIDECANILRAYEKYQELVAFYKYRARHGQALELLANLGQLSAGRGKSSSVSGGAGGAGAANTPAAANTSSAIAELSGTEPTIKYLQELAINIHQPCYPMPGIADSASPSSSAEASVLPSQFSPAASLEPNPEAIIALILHFSKWVLQADTDDGLRIFLFCHTMNLRPVDAKSKGNIGSSATTIVHSHAYHQEHCIPSRLVLDHLKKCADREVCIAYLESLIQNVGETSAFFHNELVFLYLDSIQKLIRAKEQREATLKSMQNNKEAGAAASHNEPERLESVHELPVRSRNSSIVRTRGATETGTSGSISASTGSSSGISTRDSSRLHILRRKLLDFLRSSVSYTAESMLSRFPRNALLEERAILLSRINQHTQALTIYAHSLNDPLQAEAYAEEYYQQALTAQANQQNSTNSALTASLIAQGRDMYLNLLQVYLKPPPADAIERNSTALNGTVDSAASANGANGSSSNEAPAPMLDAALMLLSKYYDRIPPVAALESLPSETTLQALWPYFERLLCHTGHQLRDDQINKQLLKAEYYSMKEQYLLARRGRVVCDQNTSCSKCNKKLGNSAFARYPNGDIVHYHCQVQSAFTPPPTRGDL